MDIDDFQSSIDNDVNSYDIGNIHTVIIGVFCFVTPFCHDRSWRAFKLWLDVVGQQLVQMPDGKLHVFSGAQAAATPTTTPRITTAANTPQQVTVVKTPGSTTPILRHLRPVTAIKPNTVISSKPAQVTVQIVWMEWKIIYFKTYSFIPHECEVRERINKGYWRSRLIWVLR